MQEALQARASIIEGALNDGLALDNSVTREDDLRDQNDGVSAVSENAEQKYSCAEDYRSNYQERFIKNAERKWRLPNSYFAVWDGNEDHHPRVFNSATGKLQVS